MAADPTTKQAQRLWPRWFIAGTKPIKVDLGPAGLGPLVDISGGGFRVQSLAPLRRGAEVPIRIDIPGNAEALQCSGIVAWSKPNGAAGIRFSGLSESQKAILHPWLAELEKAATNPAQAQVQDEFTNIVSQIRGAQLNNADALNMIARRVKALGPVSGAAIALGTPENMICLAAAGESPAVGSSIPAVIGLTGECIFKRKTIQCDDSKNDPRVGRESGFGSAVILPLTVSGEVRGVLQAFSKRTYAFDAALIDALEKFADAVVFVTHGIVTQRRLATAKAAMPVSTIPTLGPKTSDALSPLSASWSAPATPTTAPAPVGFDAPISTNTTVPKPASQAMASKPVLSSPKMSVATATTVAVAPVAEAIVYERLQRVPTPKLPPRWKEEQQAKSVSAGKWISIAVAVLAVSAIPAWYFVGRHHQPVASTPSARNPEATSAVEPAQAAEVVSTPVALAQPAAKNPVIAAPAVIAIADKKSPALSVKHEEKIVHAEPAPPEPEPIVLSENVPRAPRPVDLDAVVPVKLPPSVAGPATVSQIALPLTSKSAPKLAAPIPEVRTGGTLIKRVNPVYPAFAKSTRVQGVVDLQLHITTDGIVDKVRCLKGHLMLASAAIDAVKQWRYDPAKLNGKPVEMETTVRLNFELEQ